MTAPLSSPPAAGRANGSPRWGLARRTLKPAYALYYRALYSRRFPGNEMLAGLVLALETRIARGDTPADKDGLGGEISGGRLGVHARPPPGASVRGNRVAGSPPAPGRRDPRRRLRRGCSAGSSATARVQPLSRRRRLRDRRRAGRCCGRVDDKSSFVAADAEHYSAEELFDVIVFNECVHYFRDATTSVAAYERFSRPEECSSSPRFGRLAATRSCATS